jgi:hypothetical protein
VSYVREIQNGGVDCAGRCLECGRYTESTAGCQSCWQRRMSEAASTVLVMNEPAFIYPTPQESTVPPGVFAKLLSEAQKY